MQCKLYSTVEFFLTVTIVCKTLIIIIFIYLFDPYLINITVNVISFVGTLTNFRLLQILKLSACKYLTDSSLEALYKKGALPALIDLDLSYSSIGQTAISALLSCCTNLVHVNLNGCTNLCQLVWGSSNHSSEMLLDACSSNSTTMASKVALRKSDHLLEVLNCTGCPNVKKILIPSTANCLYLSKLNFNLSTSLKEVDLTCISLCTLNLRSVFPSIFFLFD